MHSPQGTSREKKRRKASLNSTVIGLLSHALGVRDSALPHSNGLRKLAGNWTAQDMGAFTKATATTRRIDEDLWGCGGLSTAVRSRTAA